MRKTVLQLHLYLSLITGLFVFTIAATGCLLVFELPMDRWLNPSVSYTQTGGGRVSYSRIQSVLNDAFPGSAVNEYDIGDPDTTVIAKMGPPNQTFRVFVDPHAGKIVGTRPGEPPSFWVRHLHRELLAGEVGTQVVRIATFVVIFQSFSGLYLWWPFKRMTVKWSSNWRRITLDLHHAAGFFSSAFLCIVAVTGLLKGYGDSLQPVFDRITGIAAGNKAIDSHAPAPAANRSIVNRVTMDEALATAQRQLPGAFAARLTPPKGPQGSYLITMKFPGDSTVPGRSWVVVDQYTGQILSTQDARTAPLAAQILIVNRAIHVGGIYGTSTRILAFLVALTLMLQLATGLAMWWRKRAVKAAPATVREPAPARA